MTASTTTDTTTDTATRAGPRAWLGLAVLGLPTLLVSIDVSVMLLALPHISAALGASSTQSLWIMDIYGFMLAGWLLTMGSLGDRIGRRKLLLTGATGFGLASLLAAFASSPLLLIGARALMGIAGATLAPSILALISSLFGDLRQRSLAISLWLVCFMGGMAIGPLVGGAVLEHFWWGAVFLLGVPVMLVLLGAGPLVLPESCDPQAGRLDLPSVALSLGAILPLIYGLTDAAAHGLQPASGAGLLAGLALGALFVRRQLRLASPLIDVRLFGNRAFSAAVGGMFGVTLTGANMLFISQYLQLVVGLSPLPAGLWMLPAVGASMLGFLLSPLLARHIRPAALIGAGLAVATCGALLLLGVHVGGPLLPLVAGWALVNLGVAPLVSLATTLVVSSVPPARAGSAAAVSETSAELAFAFGIASLGSLGGAIYRLQLARAPLGDLPPAARESLAGALGLASDLPAALGAPLRAAAQTAFVDSLHVVAMVSAVILLGVGLLALSALRHIPVLAQAAVEQPAADSGGRREGRPEQVGRQAGDAAHSMRRVVQAGAMDG